MDSITGSQVLALLQGICTLMDGNSIPYLVYGSVAYSLITDDQVEWNDIDIVVSESDFERLVIALGSSNLTWCPFKPHTAFMPIPPCTGPLISGHSTSPSTLSSTTS